MAELDDILSQLETTLQAKSEFTDAHIYQREERPDDPPIEDINAPSIYLKPLDPVIPESDFYLDFRRYPVEITVKFEGRRDESLRDEGADGREAIQLKTHEYLEALMDVIKDYPTNTGTIVYKVDGRQPRLRVLPTGELLESDRKRPEQIIHRCSIVFNFETAQAYA